MMENELRNRLRISERQLEEINSLLLDPNLQCINEFLAVVEKHGTVEEINRKAEEARRLPNLLSRLQEIDSPYLADLEWLTAQRDRYAFVPVADYRRKLLCDKAETTTF